MPPAVTMASGKEWKCEWPSSLSGLAVKSGCPQMEQHCRLMLRSFLEQAGKLEGAEQCLQCIDVSLAFSPKLWRQCGPGSGAPRSDVDIVASLLGIKAGLSYLSMKGSPSLGDVRWGI